jgi:hypothetical protein
MILLVSFISDFFSGVDTVRMADFFTRLFLNSVSVFILIRFIFYPNNGQSELLFTYFLMGLIVFTIASTLDNLKLEFGFAMGLFAVFSIIRFRTINVELKELTYLFITIGLSVINALVDFKVEDWHGLLLTNFIILILAFSMEKYRPRKAVLKKSLTFTVSGLHVLNSIKLLKEEIKNKTKLDIFRVEIIKISESKNEVTVWIYFRPSNN